MPTSQSTGHARNDEQPNDAVRLTVHFTDEQGTNVTRDLPASHVLHRSGDAFFLIADTRTTEAMYAGRDFDDEDLYPIDSLPARYAANPNALVLVKADPDRLRHGNYQDIVPRRVTNVSFVPTPVS